MMKQLVFILALITVLIATAPLSHATVYSIARLTDNNEDDFMPMLNDIGQVIWRGETSAEIFFYNGTSVSPVTMNDNAKLWYDINNSGQIVVQEFDGSHWRVFQYNGLGSGTPISDTSYDAYFPRINDAGQVAWQGYGASGVQTYLFDGGSAVPIGPNLPFTYPPGDQITVSLNNQGQVAWSGFDGSDWEIFLYNGTSARQLTDDSFTGLSPDINDSGQVAWFSTDDYLSPSILEVLLFDGSSIISLSDNPPFFYGGWYPRINDSGQVVWSGPDPIIGNLGVFLYNGTQLGTIGSMDHPSSPRYVMPVINNDGFVAWRNDDWNGVEIFVFDGNEIMQITDSGIENVSEKLFPEINQQGDVAWMGYDGNDFEIYLARNVTGQQNSPPIADAGSDQTVECTGPDGASVTLNGTGSSDPDGNELTYTWTGPFGTATGSNPTVQFPLTEGAAVTLTVSDGISSASDSVSITVQDTTAPELSVSVSPDVLSPPNHKMVLITPSLEAADTCDSSPSVVLKQIISNEGDETSTYDPDYDATVGDGNTINDIQIDAAGNIYLRAERSGTDSGRVYTITYTASDAAGNSVDALTEVIVPH